MDCVEERVDMRIPNPEGAEESQRIQNLLFKLNHTNPTSAEYREVLEDIFGENLGENSFIAPPLSGVAFNRIKIGDNVYINSYMLAMARGGVTIEDDVQIAGNVSLLTNNHDPYDRQVLICKPIVIRESAWIGAGSIILPGVEIGRFAIVGAGAVVTKDVPDYSVVVGNPARVVKTLDKSKFAEG